MPQASVRRETAGAAVQRPEREPGLVLQATEHRTGPEFQKPEPEPGPELQISEPEPGRVLPAPGLLIKFGDLRQVREPDRPGERADETAGAEEVCFPKRKRLRKNSLPKLPHLKSYTMTI